MAKIKQHIPNFYSGFKQEIGEFNTLEELLTIQFVSRHKKLPNGRDDPSFYRYSISHQIGFSPSFNRYALMAEYDNGKSWWIIGFMNENEVIKELPIFEAK